MVYSCFTYSIPYIDPVYTMCIYIYIRGIYLCCDGLISHHQPSAIIKSCGYSVLTQIPIFQQPDPVQNQISSSDFKRFGEPPAIFGGGGIGQRANPAGQNGLWYASPWPQAFGNGCSIRCPSSRNIDNERYWLILIWGFHKWGYPQMDGW